MKLDWLIMAEGFGLDAGGVITLIGINQNVLIATSLPTITKRALVAHVVDDSGKLSEGSQVAAVFTATDPSGAVITRIEGKLVIRKRLLPDLPPTLDLPAEFRLTIKEFGAYTLGVEVSSADGTPATGSLTLHVMQRPAAEKTSE